MCCFIQAKTVLRDVSASTKVLAGEAERESVLTHCVMKIRSVAWDVEETGLGPVLQWSAITKPAQEEGRASQMSKQSPGWIVYKK